MCSNIDRQQHAKKIIERKGRDVIEQRANRRQRLFQRLKSQRIQKTDSSRNVNTNELTYEDLCELKQILATLDQSILHEDDIDGFLNDLEAELKIAEGEQYDKLCAEEIEAITSNLLNKCEICDSLIIENGICDQCAQRHLMNQF